MSHMIPADSYGGMQNLSLFKYLMLILGMSRLYHIRDIYFPS